jgi:apolipoprotein N-acyltransferase
MLRTAGLLLLGVVAIWLAFAPAKQFYLAWIGLAPILLAIRDVRTIRAAFLWGWGAGISFFLINIWWMGSVTVAGMAALVIYAGLFWAIAAMLIRASALMGRWDATAGRALPPRRPLRCALLVAALWCGLEWLRGTYSPFGAHGLPLLYIGHSQTPFLASCQIADIVGVYGVSFWVVLINALLAMIWIDRANLKRLLPAILDIAALMIAIVSYGLFRLHQQTVRPGPTVMVVQCNYPQSNTGDKGAGKEDIAAFHARTTDAALAACDRRGQKIDLVVWSETMMPPLNLETRNYVRGTDFGNFIEQTSQQISDLAGHYRTSFLVGSTFEADWQWVTESDGHAVPEPLDRRNSAYAYGPTGLMSPERYDKIQLLPFGEFVPYREAIPWLYHLLVELGPADLKQYQLIAGEPDALTVFPLDQIAKIDPASSEPVVATQAWRFVTPICFEDLLAPLVRDLLWGPDGKRADFIVNITNDGWFPGSERAQHLQDAIFRCIENRVPAARSVNTGISGFIDSDGRTSNLVAPSTEGWSVNSLQLDNRTTLYSRTGDIFAELCAAAGVGIVVYGLTIAVQNRRRR